MIEIRKFFKPDLEIVRPNRRYPGDWEKFSAVFSEHIMVVQNCFENGEEKDSWTKCYYACRITNDVIEICIPKYGWVTAYDDINQKYKEEIAEKILLGAK